MNLNELKSNWEALYGEPVSTHNEETVRKLIASGTTEKVAQLNRKLFKELLVTGVSTAISAVAVVVFYFHYDAVKHPWIDVSKLIPIQLIAFIIFLVLFAFGYAEYRLVNRKFTANTLQDFLSATVRASRKYYWTFTSILSVLLLFSFFLLLNYFVNPSNAGDFVIVGFGAVLLTGVGYLTMRYYYNRCFAGHFRSLERYWKELSE